MSLTRPYRPAYNLNEQAHDATIALISHVLDNKFNITDVRRTGDDAKQLTNIS